MRREGWTALDVCDDRSHSHYWRRARKRARHMSSLCGAHHKKIWMVHEEAVTPKCAECARRLRMEEERKGTPGTT